MIFKFAKEVLVNGVKLEVDRLGFVHENFFYGDYGRKENKFGVSVSKKRFYGIMINKVEQAGWLRVLNTKLMETVSIVGTVFFFQWQYRNSVIMYANARFIEFEAEYPFLYEVGRG